MDTSEEYIEMCRNAAEIQEGHKYNSGDFYMGCPYDDGYYSVSGKISTYGSYDEFNMVPGDVWLPRQDQLQDMLLNKREILSTPIDLFKALVYWLSDTEALDFDPDGLLNFDTMEKMWISYYMQTCYHKKWNGSEWVKA